MPKFRRKPIVVEAEQFFPERKPWPKRVKGAEGYAVWIETPEGVLDVSPGDWIIQGEKYPCKPDIFEQLYEEVT